MIEYVASENAGSVRAYSVHPGVIVTEMSTKSVNMSPDPEATRAGHTWDDGMRTVILNFTEVEGIDEMQSAYRAISASGSPHPRTM